MTAFKSGSNQLFPYQWQFTYMCAEHVYPLRPCYFCIEIVFFGDPANDDQFIRCYFSARNAGYYGISSSFLNISQVAVVGILDSSLF